MMQKNKGFTVLELLVVMVFVGIIALMTAPDLGKSLAKERYRAAVQAFFDVVIEARNNALNNKVCGNGAVSTAWYVSSGNATNTYTLNCRDAGGDNTERTVDFVDELALVDYTYDFDVTGFTPSIGGLFNLHFLSGSSQVKILQNAETSPTRDNLHIVFDSLWGDRQSICLERVSGFPLFNKIDESCSN